MKLNTIYSSLSSSTMSNTTTNITDPHPSSSSSSGALKTFHLFPLLPTELRLKIYDAILEISYTSSPSPSPPSSTPPKPWDPTLKTTKRILKISFEPGLGRYVSNTPPPILLGICAEARAYALSSGSRKQHSFLSLGPSLAASSTKSIRQRDVEIDTGSFTMRPKATCPLPIPVSFADDTLYISTSLPAPLFSSTHVNDLLFYLSTSPCRHRIESLAFDLRVWNEMTENGIVGILAGMRALREVLLVVEFGRSFKGELGFLEQPEWRGDLKWVGDKAEADLRGERVRRGGRKVMGGEEGKGKGKEGDVRVRCVLLTRGGEQA